MFQKQNLKQVPGGAFKPLSVFVVLTGHGLSSRARRPATVIQ
jgi:hypothetical protein